MPYIDRDIALKLLERNSITKHITFSDGVSIYDTIANIPTADVVPRSDYERMRNAAEYYKEKAYANRTDVAREIFAEIDRLMLDGLVGEKYPAKVINPDKYAELKKKYTEDHHDSD